MHYRRQLRSRIILSFLIFGIVLTALFASTTLIMREWLEEDLIESTLQREVDSAVALNRRNPQLGAGVPFSGINGRVIGKHRFAEIPFDQQLETGVYERSEVDVETGQMRYYKLAVRKSEDFWGFLKYDITDQRRTRQVLTMALLGAVAVFSVLSVGVAYWLSRRVLRPVTDLVNRVNAFEQSAKRDALAPHFAADEVGQLAASLDAYSNRLSELVERDREFNADVSHELRTPLAVIRGATELILSQPNLDDRTKQRIKRIERAVQQSSELTTALLHLSRSERHMPGDVIFCDVATIIDSVVDTNRTHLVNKPIEVRVIKSQALKVEAPDAVVAVALNNLIGNAFKYTQSGMVEIIVEQGQVIVRDTGPGIRDSESKKLFERGYRGQQTTGKGAGIGLAIVSRLCELYNWQVSLQARADQQTGAEARLRF